MTIEEKEIVETERQAMLDQMAEVSKVKTPYCCPVCGGSCIVPGGFYLSPSGNTISTNVTEPCKSCQGTGIIWG